MKPVIKKKLAVFHPQGFLDGGNARGVIEHQDIELVKSSKCEVVLVSLKRIVFFNRRGLSTVLEGLQNIGNSLGAMIGFCDYDDKKFRLISDMYGGHVPFSLFDTESIGALFAVSSSKEPSACKILVYNKSVEQKNQLTVELYELGYNPIVAKDLQEFDEKSSDFEYTLKNSYLGSSDRAVRIYIKNGTIVYTLKDFLDSNLADDFDMLHHENALKIGFNYFLFDCEHVASTNVHAINFIAKLSTAGAEYGATIAVSGLTEQSITKALRNDLEDSGVLVFEKLEDFFIDETLFGEDGGGALSEKKPRHINKKLVEVLSLVVETFSKVMESMTHDSLVKKDIKVQDLEVNQDIELVSVAIAFYGQIEGMMVLVLEKSVAKKACSVLLRDDSNDDDLRECLVELVNVIGGKLAQQMKRKNYKVDITMPRAYNNTKDLLSHKKGTKGAQVDFELDGKSVVLFLTR